MSSITYRWRARTYPWAVAKITQAEALHGTPPDDDDSHDRECPGCGRMFAPTRANHHYCTPACRERRRRARE